MLTKAPVAGDDTTLLKECTLSGVHFTFPMSRDKFSINPPTIELSGMDLSMREAKFHRAIAPIKRVLFITETFRDTDPVPMLFEKLNIALDTTFSDGDAAWFYYFASLVAQDSRVVEELTQLNTKPGAWREVENSYPKGLAEKIPALARWRKHAELRGQPPAKKGRPKGATENPVMMQLAARAIEEQLLAARKGTELRPSDAARRALKRFPNLVSDPGKSDLDKLLTYMKRIRKRLSI